MSAHAVSGQPVSARIAAQGLVGGSWTPLGGEVSHGVCGSEASDRLLGRGEQPEVELSSAGAAEAVAWTDAHSQGPCGHVVKAAALDELDDERLQALVDGDLRQLGSLSLGKPNAGALFNPRHMPVESDRWEIVVKDRAWGTSEVIDYLVRAIDRVHQEFPNGTHKLSIGHISSKKGGRLYPHRSHQSGRDADIGFYYLPGKEGWYRPAVKHTLDAARTWALIRAMITDTDIEMMFIDRSVQRMIYKHALEAGEDKAWLDTVFQFRRRHPQPIVRHAWGHATHIHVRFYSPSAQRLGARLYGHMARRKLIAPRRSRRRGSVALVRPGFVPARRMPPAQGVSLRSAAGPKLGSRH